MVDTTILRGDMGPGEVQRQQQGSGRLGVAGTYGPASNVTVQILLYLRYRWSFIGWADGDSTQRTQVDSGEIPPSAAGRRRWSASRLGGAVHRRGREWGAARSVFGEAPPPVARGFV